MYMYVKIRRHQHTRVHAHTYPRRHARAPACCRHHIPRPTACPQAGIPHRPPKAALVCVADQKGAGCCGGEGGVRCFVGVNLPGGEIHFSYTTSALRARCEFEESRCSGRLRGEWARQA